MTDLEVDDASVRQAEVGLLWLLDTIEAARIAIHAAMRVHLEEARQFLAGLSSGNPGLWSAYLAAKERLEDRSG